MKPTIKDYKILKYEDLKELEKEVKKLLKKGYDFASETKYLEVEEGSYFYREMINVEYPQQANNG
jgi:hypothetical protein